MTIVGTKNQSNREAWLERTLKQVPTGSRILDAGAGEQQYKKFCSHLEYVSQDFGQYDGSGNNTGLQTESWDQSNLDIVSDITGIPEPDGSFDAIMCIEVFEHIAEPIKAIQEFSRLLRPHGYLILTAPFCSLTHFAPYHYYSGFNRYFYEKHLQENDFEIIDLQENENYFEYLAQEVRRVSSVAKCHTKSHFNIFELLVTKLYLSILERLSKNDNSSAELLHFGYHVFAIKK